MLIAFVGTDGAGKSTQVQLMERYLVDLGCKVVTLDKWDILDHKKVKECRFISSSLDDLRNCIAEMDGCSRSLFLFWSIDISLKAMGNEPDSTIYLADGYWMKHAASEIIYEGKKDWIMSIVSTFPKPDLTLYFDINPHLASVRKENFTRYECGRSLLISTDTFLTHQFKLKALMDEWSSVYQWTRIDAAQDLNRIRQEVRDVLAPLITGAIL